MGEFVNRQVGWWRDRRELAERDPGLRALDAHAAFGLDALRTALEITTGLPILKRSLDIDRADVPGRGQLFLLDAGEDPREITAGAVRLVRRALSAGYAALLEDTQTLARDFEVAPSDVQDCRTNTLFVVPRGVVLQDEELWVPEPPSPR